MLAGPVSLDATGGCAGTLLPQVVLTWPATTSRYATGYAVFRRIGADAFVQVGLVSGRATTTYTDATIVVAAIYDYQVRAVFQQWTGSSPTDPATTPVLCLL